jgi:hypothetical protein
MRAFSAGFDLWFKFSPRPPFLTNESFIHLDIDWYRCIILRHMKRLSPADLDAIAVRLEQIEIEEETLRSQLLEQVQEFGFTPPRAERSKRLHGSLFQFTLSRSLTTEVKDAEVERIRAVCRGDIFDKLFRTVTRYKLAEGATLVLATHLPPDAPRNLRLMFSRAVSTKETAARLRIDKVEVASTT